MNGSIALRLFFLSLFSLAASAAASAAELECTKYVPAAGKTIAVPCEEGRPSSPPPAATSPAPPVESGAPAPVPEPPAASTRPPSSDELSVVEKIQKMVTEYLGALAAAKADPQFRDKYCLAKATAELIHQEKDKREYQRLWDQHVALEAELGQLGKLFYQALDEQVAKLFLDTPVDNAEPRSTRFRQTPLGASYTKARDEALKMSCQCARAPDPPKWMVCCDSCDQATLRARFTQKFPAQ